MAHFARLEEEPEEAGGSLQPRRPSLRSSKRATFGLRGYNEHQDLRAARRRASTAMAEEQTPDEADEERVEAASTVQHWYRRHCAKYSVFGPVNFVCKDGRLADFGSLSYLSGAREAQFVRVSDTTSSSSLSQFLEKFWRLPRPDVLISVTGAADSILLTSQLRRVFDRGLAAAAAMTNAWIFTGGTDSGVMKLVGEAMHKYGLVDVPIIGIAPWGAIVGRDAMQGCKGEHVNYRGGGGDDGGGGGGDGGDGGGGSESSGPGGPGGQTKARLNPYHTHQVLVDSHRRYGPKTASSWGDEIPLRSRLERTYSHEKGVPVVLLVVQGGAHTLDMMLSSAEAGCPLLVLSDSGGAATAAWQYFEQGSGSVDEPGMAAHEPKLEALRALHEARGGTLVSFFRLQDEDAQENMSSALLTALFRHLMFVTPGEAVIPSAIPPAMAKLRRGSGREGAPVAAVAEELVKRHRDHLKRALLLTVKWNQPEFARRILLDLPASQDNTQPLRMMLQLALELGRVELVRLLLERPGTMVSHVNLCQLYLREDAFNFLSADQRLQHRLQLRLSEIVSASPLATRGQYAIYREVLGPSLESTSSLLRGILASQREGSHVDLFVWATFHGDLALARELWAHVDQPLHCALIASYLLRRISDKIGAASANAAALALEVEGWAVGVMELVHEQEVAHWVLSQQASAWRMGALIDLAMQMGMKAFLGQKHCQSLMDLRWRGGHRLSGVTLSTEHSLPTIAGWAFLVPWANPYRVVAARPARSGGGDADYEGDELMLAALAEALALKAHEKERAVQAWSNSPIKQRSAGSGGEESPPPVGRVRSFGEAARSKRLKRAESRREARELLGSVLSSTRHLGSSNSNLTRGFREKRWCR